MTDACVSELTIDRMLVGELAPAAATRVRAHAGTCTECGALLANAERYAAGFAAHRPALHALRRRRIDLAAALAAAAAAVVAIAWPRGETIMTKGGAILGFYVAHGDDLRRGQDREVVAPGDRLQLVTTLDAPAWLAVTGVDAAGTRTVYAAPAPVAAGRDRPLAFSITLDATPGRSTITAVFCPQPFALDRPPAACTSDAFTIETRR